MLSRSSAVLFERFLLMLNEGPVSFLGFGSVFHGKLLTVPKSLKPLYTFLDGASNNEIVFGICLYVYFCF